jgi:Holliday junction resolvase RusA-like endonuclease
MSIQFFVPGIPKPKGSTKSFYNPKAKRIVTMNACGATKGWQSLISTCAIEAGVTYNDQRGVAVGIGFLLPRPKNHFNQKGLKANAPPLPINRTGDLDKLIRAVLDGLTGIAYLDDSQVAEVFACKRYTDFNPGASITLKEL